MALEGTFGDFGLAEIFQLIGLQKKTGVLTVKGGTEESVVTVSFDKGMVTFADEYQRSETERLGAILLRSHLVTKEALDRAMQTQKETLQRLGHVLTQMEFISQKDLRQALQTQVKETVYRLFRWKEGAYHFSSEPVTYDKEMYQPIAAEFLLMEGVRMIDEWPIIEKKITSLHLVFEKVPGREPPSGPIPEGGEQEWDDLVSSGDEGGAAGEKPAPPAGVGQSSLSTQEESIFRLVDGVRSVQDIIDIGKMGEFETCKNLYSLLSVGMIRQVEEHVAPRPSRAARGAPGSSFPPVADIAAVGAAVALVMAAFLFNPWSFFELRYSVNQSRGQIGSLRDDLKLMRLRHALQVFYLEKQTYPVALEKLPEDKMIDKTDIHDHQGVPFVYNARDKDYELSKIPLPGDSARGKE